MDEKNMNGNEEIEIDLKRLFGALVRKSWLIGITAILCAVVMFLATVFFVDPEYQATTMIYVNNNSFSLGEVSLSSITSSDISASRGLVKSYIVILKSRETLNDVIDYAGVNRTYTEVKGMISAASVDSTEIFEVVVTSTDPVEAEKIADAIAHVLPKRISSIIEGTSANIVDYAVLPAAPSSPNYTKNTMLGFVIGLALSIVLILIRELMDITIHSEEDIARVCTHPVLAEVPDMEAPNRGGHYYGYGQKKKGYYDKSGPKDPRQTEVVGGEISFAAAEAYKLLRTKLLFSFADENNCRVIGVSSALTGEGKSLSSVNLAYTTSQLGKRVLLIDCDMRRSSLADKMPIKRTPGLSDYLAGQSSAETLIQLCGIKDDESAFHVIGAGRTPPNPIELLSSERMKRMLNRLRENYDYIILDLPPVGEVSDALAAAKITDGMLIVVRQNYCDRIALGAAIRQFEFVESRILGIVFNSTNETGGYGQGYYKKYYKKYARYAKKYDGNYASADKSSRKKAGKR